MSGYELYSVFSKAYNDRKEKLIGIELAIGRLNQYSRVSFTVRFFFDVAIFKCNVSCQ